MNAQKQLAIALKAKANRAPFLASLRRRVMAAAREEARRALAVAGESERPEALALLHEIETALAHAEIQWTLNEVPGMAERVKLRRERRQKTEPLSGGLGHG